MCGLSMLFVRTVGPNEALVVSGCCIGRPKIVIGGYAIVVPVLHTATKLSLHIMTLAVETHRVYTKAGVAMSVTGTAQVKFKEDMESLRHSTTQALLQFLGMNMTEVHMVALQTMEGHQRAILGTLTVEQIYQDRHKFAEAVKEVADHDIAGMGMEIISYTIKDVSDDEGYLDALGKKRTAEVKRDARIGEAQAGREASVKESEADFEKQKARFLADENIAKSKFDYEVKQAQFDAGVRAKRADAELAYPLQEAKTRQLIKAEEVTIQIVEKKKNIELQEQEIKRREKELDATVKLPADAEKYRLHTVAEGAKMQKVAQAEGESQSIKLKGDAEAAAILARGKAEAEQMALKASAWQKYGQAAVIDQILHVLPSVAKAVSEPLSKTDKIVMIGGAGGSGASALTRDVANVIAQVPPTVEALTGVDLVELVKNAPHAITQMASTAAGAAAGSAAGTAMAHPKK